RRAGGRSTTPTRRCPVSPPSSRRRERRRARSANGPAPLPSTRAATATRHRATRRWRSTAPSRHSSVRASCCATCGRDSSTSPRRRRADGATGCAGSSASRRWRGGTGPRTASPGARRCRSRLPSCHYRRRVDPTARFTTLVQGPEPAIPLDQLVLLDAAEGFTGNAEDYYDPRNSFLDEVIQRRVGIPITLSIVTIEVGRRVGVPIVGIGMPGHFLVRDAMAHETFADPFNGRLLDPDGCRRLYEQGGGTAFEDRFLAPVGTRAIVARLLANLKAIYLSRRDRDGVAWVLRLRVEVPGVPLDERRELASALAADGRFVEAAKELDHLAALAAAAGRADLVDEAERGATRLRARLN